MYVHSKIFCVMRASFGVGLCLHNLQIDGRLDNPDSYPKTTSIRSRVEASNGNVKRNSSMKGQEFCGLKCVTSHIGFYKLGVSYCI